MHFPSLSKKGDAEELPTIEEPKPSYETSKSAVSDKTYQKDSSVTSPTKPSPARNPSTRIHHSSTVKPTTSKKAQRPGLNRRSTTADTGYIRMLLGLDEIPALHNVLAGLFTYLLLAGYIVFPATFKTFKSDKDLDDKANSELKKHALNSARNIPLLYVAAFSCGIGVLGCMWLYIIHRKNYVWVIQRIFLPALMNSIAGLISTFINIYSAQEGQYSASAKSTLIVTAVFTVLNSALFLFYNFCMLWFVKRKHKREMRAVHSQSLREGV